MKETMKKNGKKLIVYILLLAAAVGVCFATGELNGDSFKLFENFDGKVLLKLAVVVLAILAASNLVAFVLSLFKPKKHRARSLLSLTESLVHYAAFIAILCAVLSIIGVNITTVIASVGILTLIVGFSAESLISDIVTGTFMLVENLYNVGDIVEVDGFRGTVTKIGIRTTSITDAGDNVKIINNSEMKNILNRSDNLSRAVSGISIPYETDLEKLEGRFPELLEDIARRNEDIFVKTPVYLGVQELGASGIELRFVAEVAEKNIFSGTRLLNRELFLGFRRLGVECPFTQVDIHTK